MSTNVIMPQLGESVVEGTVSKWLKREGDRVNEFDPILEVNTDKVDTEIPSPAAGVLLKVLVPEGTTVKAGTVLALIGQPGDEPRDEPADGGRAEPESAPVSHPVGEPFRPRAQSPQRPAPSRQPAAQGADVTALDSAIAAAFRARSGGAAAKRDLGFISPVVARLAGEHNVDLQQVTGTGQGGRITKKDVLAFVEAQSLPPRPEQPEVPQHETQAELPPWEKPGEGDLFRPTELQFGSGASGAAAAGIAETTQAQPSGQTLRVSETLRVVPVPDEDSIPVEGMRKLIAEHMVRSERTTPHVTTVFEADLSAVLAHQAAHAAEFTRDGATLTLTAYFVAAAVAALKAVPIVNSQWAEDRILLKREINIGLAVALDEGLIVPVIKRADEKSLLGLAREINDLARRGRGRALKPDEVQGGTFTITNHGVSGSLFATPIINQPQSAILGVGVMQKRAVVINDAIAIRPMIYLTLTFDHRVLDGAVADRFMGKVKEALENWR
jgi:pyruvate/2-oxoglutarate dehydrogenase complex dihydrolipoamide acyltransferase (E2) component